MTSIRTLFGFIYYLIATVGTNGAVVAISNIVQGPASANWEGDTLHANRDGTLMNGGSVTMGYFPADVSTANVDTIEELIANLASFTALTSAVPGSLSPILGTANPGYADQSYGTYIGLIGHESPLLGRTLYTVITSATTISSAKISSQFALYAITNFRLDEPLEETYTSNPSGVTPIIGKIGSYTGDAGAGFGQYLTLNMDLATGSSVVPEPTTLLFAASGLLSFARRRRLST